MIGKAVLAFDGDQLRIWREALENIAGELAGAGTVFDKQMGTCPVDLFELRLDRSSQRGIGDPTESGAFAYS